MAIFSQTWLTPFIYLAVLLGVFLFAPKERRETVQQRLRTDPNFYMICDIILMPFAIWATLDWRHRWIDYFCWVLLIILLAISIPRALKPAPPAEPDEPPPL